VDTIDYCLRDELAFCVDVPVQFKNPSKAMYGAQDPASKLVSAAQTQALSSRMSAVVMFSGLARARVRHRWPRSLATRLPRGSSTASPRGPTKSSGRESVIAIFVRRTAALHVGVWSLSLFPFAGRAGRRPACSFRDLQVARNRASLSLLCRTWDMAAAGAGARGRVAPTPARVRTGAPARCAALC
jgi:hypothetical protein